MSRPAALGAVATALIMTAMPAPVAFAVSNTAMQDPALGEVAVTCDDHVRRDYRAKTASSVALTGDYARERGADRGLVRRVD